MCLQDHVDLLGEIQYVSGGFLVGGVCVIGLVGNSALFVLLSKQVRELLFKVSISEKTFQAVQKTFHNLLFLLSVYDTVGRLDTR